MSTKLFSFVYLKYIYSGLEERVLEFPTDILEPIRQRIFPDQSVDICSLSLFNVAVLLDL
jgi:hypothetical protein